MHDHNSFDDLDLFLEIIEQALYAKVHVAVERHELNAIERAQNVAVLNVEFLLDELKNENFINTTFCFIKQQNQLNQIMLFYAVKIGF